MKVILRSDVAKIGRRHEVVEVPHGYALNKLIPSGQADPATPANLKKLKSQTAVADAAAAADTAQFEAAAEQLLETTVTVPVKVNEQGHMFAALSADEVSVAASTQDIDLPAKFIQFKNVIKETGEHTVQMVLGSDTRSFTIDVTAAK